MIEYANNDDGALGGRTMLVLFVVAKRRKQMSHLHFDLYCRIVEVVEIVADADADFVADADVVADVARPVDFYRRILVQTSDDCCC